MTEQEEVQQALKAFRNLSKADRQTLQQLNTDIQNHRGPWGTPMGGQKNPDGSIEMPWTQNDPLIGEFINFMYDRGLVPTTSWTGKDAAAQLLTSDGPAKYDNLDLETVLKVIFIATRKDRFAGGAFVRAFEAGDFPKLVNRLVQLLNNG
ncbi:MAG TPA: DUF6508 domain-containing protein [Candidatus Saccharimonadales bacterium]|nr:DUF6508 domain-containing protein [Candidatus Saccharimonadales bacterium]